MDDALGSPLKNARVWFKYNGRKLRLKLSDQGEICVPDLSRRFGLDPHTLQVSSSGSWPEDNTWLELEWDPQSRHSTKFNEHMSILRQAEQELGVSWGHAIVIDGNPLADDAAQPAELTWTEKASRYVDTWNFVAVVNTMLFAAAVAVLFSGAPANPSVATREYKAPDSPETAAFSGSLSNAVFNGNLTNVSVTGVLSNAAITGTLNKTLDDAAAPGGSAPLCTAECTTEPDKWFSQLWGAAAFSSLLAVGVCTMWAGVLLRCHTQAAYESFQDSGGCLNTLGCGGYNLTCWPPIMTWIAALFTAAALTYSFSAVFGIFPNFFSFMGPLLGVFMIPVLTHAYIFIRLTFGANN